MAALAGEFLCPECHAKLRINQRGKDSAEIPCPECDLPLQIQLTAQGKLAVSWYRETSPDEILHNFSEEEVPLWKQQPSKSSSSFSLFIIGAILFGLLLAGTWWFNVRSTNSVAKNGNNASNVPLISQSEIIPEGQKEMDFKTTAPVGPQKNPSPDQAKPLPFVKNLNRLSQQVNAYREQNHQFPSALWSPEESSLSANEQFSWLAGLDPALQQDTSLLPQWNLSWQDPLNDRFVRRSRPELLNPAIRLQASPDRYPATHIVGISGVGKDAPNLPAEHPRAGIFGLNRTTRTEEVTDGLSNTMLAAGVTEKLASWSEGTTSIRSFTQQPYINGPDGFGSGQKNTMLVLMADGSVRTLSSKTSPVIIRRMAAMADGYPLDPKVLGEPGDKKKSMPSKKEPPIQTPDLPPKNSTPINPPTPDPTKLPEPVPPIDFEKALARQVLDFDLVTPAPLETVLIELEAMIGVPIKFEPKQIPRTDPVRKHKVKFSKRNVTFEELLTELIKPASLQYELHKDRIVIIKVK